jgi:hypothetical protein
MNMIGHDYIPTHCPAVAVVRRPPFINQDLCYLRPGENCASVVRARRHKIDGRINPNPIESAQMSVGGHG